MRQTSIGVLFGCFGRKIDGPGLPAGLIIYQGHLFAPKGHLCKQASSSRLSRCHIFSSKSAQPVAHQPPGMLMLTSHRTQAQAQSLRSQATQLLKAKLLTCLCSHVGSYLVMPPKGDHPLFPGDQGLPMHWEISPKSLRRSLCTRTSLATSCWGCLGHFGPRRKNGCGFF